MFVMLERGRELISWWKTGKTKEEIELELARINSTVIYLTVPVYQFLYSLIKFFLDVILYGQAMPKEMARRECSFCCILVRVTESLSRITS